MKIFLRILSIIIEIIIAVAIFIMIVQKTPLFDRAIPGRSSGWSWDLSTINTSIPSNSTSETDSSMSWKNIILSWWTTQYENKTISSIENDFTSNIITDQPVEQWLSCKSPRWSDITDGNSIIAYQTQRANNDNKCYSEIRTCQNWSLWGSFTYKICDYIVDGQLIKNNGTREDTIVGASDANQKLINLNNFYKKTQSISKEYIQPKPYKDSNGFTISQAKPQKMDNSKITINQNLTDTLDQTTTQDDHSTKKSSCRTPRWKTIIHGSFIYAYNFPINTIEQQCIVQKRSCNDGVLWWSYRYEFCKFNSNDDSPQDIIQSKPSTIYRWTLSPYSPYTRSLNDSIQDRLLFSHSNINWTTNGQNYIEISNCITPWWDSIPNGARIVAYRLPYQTSNSLCDAEIRTCRNSILWWVYTYASCSQTNPINQWPHTTWIEDAWSRIGWAANDSVSRVGGAVNDSVNRIWGAANTVWDWIGGLF
jgi:hypothetical protein